MILQTPDQTSSPPKLADLLELLSQPPQPADPAFPDPGDDDAECPPCPHCGSRRTRLLGEYARRGGP